MRRHVRAVLRGGLACHPAVAAWRQLAPDAPDPQRIEVLREGTKSNTYRLVESTPDGASIIAQRARMAKALIERTVYEEILPHLPVTSPRYHGFRTENPHFAWLFLEDVGDERYATSDREQYALAGRWLGLMHTSTPMRTDAWPPRRVCRTEDRAAIYSTSARHARISCAISAIPPSPSKRSLC